KSFVVTPENIELYPPDMLVKRYHSITRTMRKKEEIYCTSELGQGYELLKEESDLIHSYLVSQQLDHLIAEQIRFPGMDKPAPETYVALVERKLRDHYTHLQHIKELEQKLKQGVQIIIPSASCVASYGGVGGGRSNQSMSERLIIRADQIEEQWKIELEDWHIQCEPMYRALEQLDEEQRLVIEKKYFSSKKPLSDIHVIPLVPFEHRKFYKVKGAALLRLAESLRIIKPGRIEIELYD
ncbi:hypothetical protein ABEU96_25880, partial [Aneurinibacillus aneurinilyticus]